MPRGPRVVLNHGIFHVTIRGNNKRCLFRRDCDYIRFKELIRRYKIKFDFYLYHYALMKNHVHLILEVSEKTSLAKLMQGLALSYYHHYRRKNKYVGHLWQGRFKSHFIENDKYLITAALYVEKNPVEAGIVSDPSEYRWSSYRYYGLGESDPIVDISPIYESMGKNVKERQKVYSELILARIAETKNNVDL